MTKAETTVERVGGYRVVRRLATGGTSDVLLAKAEGPHGFERTVVLKLLLSEFRNDQELARMFAREAAAYARLSHPSIVRLFDFFALPSAPHMAPQPGGRDGQLVMVLEYIDGPPLGRLRTMLKAVGKELDDRTALYIAARIFDALAAAHEATDDDGLMAPVIHRDVNPSNVLVPWDGHVKLADFGVAKVTGMSHQSVAGMIKGTYGYMAPEQVTGEPVTPRADVYAGAIILWELLTRRRAFQRGALPEMEALRTMAEPRLVALDTLRPDVDRSIRDAVKRALEPRAERRTITAEEMVSILTSIVPTDEGRERLANVLGSVRNDARAAAAANSSPPGEMSRPPSTVPNPHTAAAAPPPAASSSASRGALPKPIAPPRPASIPNMPAHAQPPKLPSRTALPATTLQGMPKSPEPPRVASRPALAATTVQSPSQERSSTSSAPPKRPSASSRLAIAVPDLPAEGMSMPPSSSTVSLFDSLIEPPGAARPPMRSEAGIGEGMRLATPLEAFTSGLALKDAIDEILRGQPSSMPPSILRESRAPAPQAPSRAAITAVMPESPRQHLGQLPAAPPPMRAGLASGAPPEPSNDFSSTVREMADVVDKAEAPTVAPPSEMSPPTPRMTPMQPLSQTLAMETRPVEKLAPEVEVRPLHSPLPALFSPVPPALGAAMPMVAPPSFSPNAPPLFGPEPAQHQQTAPHSVPPRAPSISSITAGSGMARPSPESSAALAAQPPRRSRATAVALALLVFAIIAGLAGTVVYLRHPKAGTASVATSSTPVAPAPLASVSSPASAAPEPSAPAAVASAAPEPSASVAATTSPTAPPSAPPSASVAPAPTESATPASAVADGSGLIKTTGAAPGRRIFVDDKTLGQTPETVTVKCGKHSVRLGSSGKAQAIDVPCGGEITIADKF